MKENVGAKDIMEMIKQLQVEILGKTVTQVSIQALQTQFNDMEIEQHLILEKQKNMFEIYDQMEKSSNMHSKLKNLKLD